MLAFICFGIVYRTVELHSLCLKRVCFPPIEPECSLVAFYISVVALIYLLWFCVLNGEY